jgi:hypothetical protein
VFIHQMAALGDPDVGGHLCVGRTKEATEAVAHALITIAIRYRLQAQRQECDTQVESARRHLAGRWQRQRHTGHWKYSSPCVSSDELFPVKHAAPKHLSALLGAKAERPVHDQTRRKL